MARRGRGTLARSGRRSLRPSFVDERPAWESASLFKAHWKFDETDNGSAADSTGRGNDITAVNSPSSVAGLVGSARRFASASAQRFHADCPDFKPSSATPWLVCGWLRASSLASQILFLTHELTGGVDARLYCYVATTGRFGVDILGTGRVGRATLAGTNGTITTNTWTFFRLWLDPATGANGTVYLRTNEADEKSAALSGSMPAMASGLCRINGNVNNGQLAPGNLDVDAWRYFSGTGLIAHATNIGTYYYNGGSGR